MNVSDLRQGKSYKIKRECSAYYGRKKQVFYTEAKFIGIDGHSAWFAIDEDREVGIDIDNVDKKVKEE